MEFIRYNSIENYNSEITLEHLRRHPSYYEDWVQTLKLHGANYAFYIDDTEIKRASRNGFLKDGENFYNDVALQYDTQLRDLYQLVKEIFFFDIDVKQVSVHGEIIGGKYNHPEVTKDPNAKVIQHEVQYCPDTKFVVTDIRVNDEYIRFDPMVILCTRVGLLMAPVLDFGSAEKLLKNSVVFDDPMYDEFDLPELPVPNKAEGWVMKPVKASYFWNGERVIFKGKSQEFVEQSRTKKIKVVAEVPEEAAGLLSEAISYITSPRLHNVLSHYNADEFKKEDFNRLSGFLVQDALVDFMKEHGEAFGKLDIPVQKLLKKKLSKEAASVVGPEFKSIFSREV